MKLRLLPVVLTVLISGGLLFGGWFAYQSLAVTAPAGEIVSGVDGVAEARIKSGRRALDIGLVLEEQADLAAVYRAVQERIVEQLGSKTVAIKIANESPAALDRIWSTALFDIAEAMDTRAYGDIPVRMKELAEHTEGLQIDTAMDHQNVYITLKMEGASKYIILPRTPAKLGVWPNEQV